MKTQCRKDSHAFACEILQTIAETSFVGKVLPDIDPPPPIQPFRFLTRFTPDFTYFLTVNLTVSSLWLATMTAILPLARCLTCSSTSHKTRSYIALVASYVGLIGSS